MKKCKLMSIFLSFAMLLQTVCIASATELSYDEEKLETAAVFYDGAFPSGAKTSTSSAWHSNITDDGEEYDGKKSLKIENINEPYAFWPEFNVYFETPISIVNRNAYLLSMDVKLPEGKSRNIYFYLKTKDSQGRSINSVLNLADFVSEEQLGKWTHINVPMSRFSSNGEYWDSNSNAMIQIPANYANITSYGFKYNAYALGKGYKMFVQNYRLLYGELEAEGADVSKAEDGSWYKIYNDLCDASRISCWGGSATSFSVVDSEETEGDHALRATFDNTARWPGGTLAFENPINISAVKQKLALKMRIYTSGDAEFKLGLSGRKLGKGYKVETDISSYIIDNDHQGMKELIIPLNDLGNTGIATDGSGSTEFPWERVTYLTFALNTKNLSKPYYVMLDDVELVETSDVIKTPKATALSKAEYQTKIAELQMKTIDLTPYKNTNYETWCGQSNIDDNFAVFDPTNQSTFLEVPFNLSSDTAILLDSGESSEVTIPLEGTMGGIYFLHTGIGQLSGKAYSFIIRYTDGTAIRRVVSTNEMISDWKRSYQTDEGRTVISVNNLAGNTVTAGIYAWVNPYPEKTPASITLEYSNNGKAIILGMTTTDKTPVMLASEKNPDANPDTSNWFAYEQPDASAILGTALDMSSFLDAPAGKYGYVKVKDGAFSFENQDKTIIFRGVNLSAEANFPTKAEADEMINRIASEGYNLVRFHHMDSSWVSPNIFKDGETLTLNENSLDAFEYLWAGLKAKGIYLYVDGVVGRKFCSGELGDLDESVITNGGKVSNYFVEAVEEKQKDYIRQLFTHINPYTNTTLAEDPAVVMMDLQNEDSLLPKYVLTWNIWDSNLRNQLSEGFCTWLSEKYKTTEALSAAWAEEGKTGLRSSETLESGKIYFDHRYLVSNYSNQRIRDTYAYLADVQTKHYERVYSYCREIGIKCMITGSNYPFKNNALDLYSNSKFGGEFIDQHNYVTHPTGGIWSYTDGINANGAFDSMMDDGEFISHFGSRRVIGMPYVISEWNQCEPNQYAGSGLLMFPAYAQMQGWSQILYNFKQGKWSNSDRITDLLNSSANPVKTAMAYATAPMLYRRDITEATVTAAKQVTQAELYNPDFIPGIENGAALIAKTGIGFDSSAESNEKVSRLAEEAAITGVYVSYEKDLRTDTNRRTFEINTAGTQGYAGFDGKAVELEDVGFALDNDYATAVLTSLDPNSAIRSSEKLLLTATARTRNTDSLLSDEGTYLKNAGTAPILVEPVRGTITLKTKDTYDVYALSSSGERKEKLLVTTLENGAQQFDIGAESTMYYELVKTNDVADDKIPGAARPEWSKSFGNINKPTGLSVSDVTKTSAILSWDAAAEAELYNIYRDQVKIASVTDATYLDDTLAAGSTYSYEVTAVKGGVESEHSDAVSVTAESAVSYEITWFKNGMTNWYQYEQHGNASTGLESKEIAGRFEENVKPWLVNVWSNGWIKYVLKANYNLNDEALRNNTAFVFDVKVSNLDKKNADNIVLKFETSNGTAAHVTVPGFIKAQTVTRVNDTLNGWMHYEIPLSEFTLKEGFDWTNINALTLAAANWQGGVFWFDNIGFGPITPEITDIRYYDGSGKVLPSDNKMMPAGAESMKLVYNKDLKESTLTGISILADGETITPNAAYDAQSKTVTVNLSAVSNKNNVSLVIPETVKTIPSVGRKGSGTIVDETIDNGSVSVAQTILLKKKVYENGFFNAAGGLISEVDETGYITAKITLTEQAKVYVAAYNGNKLVSVRQFNGAVGANSFGNIYVEKGQKVKMFTWSGISGMTPIMPKYEI